MQKRRIGLALGSGGARGWCHIGVLRALESLGIQPDVIAGCSMGALVGAAYCGGRLDALETWALAQTRGSILGLVDVRLAGGGIVGGARIAALLKSIGLAERLEELQKPFLAVAADIETGQEVWLREGEIAPAIRASTAMPGILAPQRIDGRWLIDGGVVNPVPVSATRALGADVIIAVNPHGRRGGSFWVPQASRSAAAPRPNLLPELPESWRRLWPAAPKQESDIAPAYIELVLAAIDIMSEQIRLSRLAGDAPHGVLNAFLPGITVLDFHRAAEAIDEGVRIVEAQADWLKAIALG